MTKEPLNLPLDFGIPDETLMANAFEAKDFEVVAELYAQGMPIADPDFDLQELLAAFEGGAALSTEAAKKIALRIYKSLALTDLTDSPLSQNAIYQMAKNAMDDWEALTPESWVVHELSSLPHVKAGSGSVYGTMLEAAFDDLEETPMRAKDIKLYMMRLEDLFPVGEHRFAQHGFDRFFGKKDDQGLLDENHKFQVGHEQQAAMGLIALLLYRGDEYGRLKNAFSSAMGGESPDRIALEVFLKVFANSLNSENKRLVERLENLAEVGFDISPMVSAFESESEYRLLSVDAGISRRFFDPAKVKPNLRDSIFSSDLGL